MNLPLPKVECTIRDRYSAIEAEGIQHHKAFQIYFTRELSLDSRGVLVGSWLFYIDKNACSLSFWCMFGATMGFARRK
jgi:hypothetical protein